MTEPNQAEITKGSPTITLDGKDWPIPVLTIRQNMVIVPIVQDFLDKGHMKEDKFLPATEEVMNGLITMIHAALTKAHPDITRDDVLDMQGSHRQMTQAFLVICRQSAGGDLPPGEAVPGTT